MPTVTITRKTGNESKIIAIKEVSAEDYANFSVGMEKMRLRKKEKMRKAMARTMEIYKSGAFNTP